MCGVRDARFVVITGLEDENVLEAIGAYVVPDIRFAVHTSCTRGNYAEQPNADGYLGGKREDSTMSRFGIRRLEVPRMFCGRRANVCYLEMGPCLHMQSCIGTPTRCLVIQMP
jgi:hypothetical protein